MVYCVIMSVASSLRRKSKRSLILHLTAKAARQPPTYWNGEPTPCRRLVVRVGTVPKSTWWCAGLEGTEREAVEVSYGREVFYLDNENGSAWAKVTLGYGGPEWGHKSLPDDSRVIRAI